MENLSKETLLKLYEIMQTALEYYDKETNNYGIAKVALKKMRDIIESEKID